MFRILFFLVFFVVFEAKDTHTLYLQAWSFYTKSQFDDALKTIEESIAKDPNFAEAWFLKARIHFKLGHPRQAIQIFKKGQEIRNRTNEFMRYSQSKGESATEYKTGVDSVAFQSLHKIKEARKSYHYGQMAARQGRWFEAIEYFEKASSLDTEKTIYLNSLAMTLLDVDDPFSAQEVVARSLNIDAFQRILITKLIESFSKLGHTEQALDWARKGLKSFPSDSWFKDRELYFEFLMRKKLRISGKEDELELLGNQ